MNFLADESIDKQIVDALREKGYEVGYVAQMDPGISDNEVLSLANKEKTILLTADKDFGELIFRLRRHSSGMSPAIKADFAVSLIVEHLQELTGNFSVITPAGIRIRQQ